VCGPYYPVERLATVRGAGSLTGWTRAQQGTRSRRRGDRSGWLLFAGCHSVRRWTATKRCLSFCEVTQDGDDEGCLRLGGLPTPERAEAIREALGIRKRREHSPVTVERLQERGKRWAQERRAA
jgi:hypothetical protein